MGLAVAPGRRFPVSTSHPFIYKSPMRYKPRK